MHKSYELGIWQDKMIGRIDKRGKKSDKQLLLNVVDYLYLSQ